MVSSTLIAAVNMMLLLISFSVFERKFTLFSANNHRFGAIIGFF